MFATGPNVAKNMDETSFANHIADHDGKIVHPVCAYCEKTFTNSSSLQLHIKNTCQSMPIEESRRKKKSKLLKFSGHLKWFLIYCVKDIVHSLLLKAVNLRL